MNSRPDLDYVPLLARQLGAARLDAGPVWVRVFMDRLDPGIKAGWKLHLSATPQSMGPLLELCLPLLADAGHPFKAARDAGVLERLNDGRFGLSQVGKAVTIYPPCEETAAQLGDALARVLDGLPGPRIPSDRRMAPGAPVYYRYGPFDGRFRIDAMGRKMRLLAHPSGGDVVDPTWGGDAPEPEPHFLPERPPFDHLAFLRDRFLFLRVLHLSAKGGVFLAAEPTPPIDALWLVKTAKAGAHSDRHGRDAPWALRREHAFLSRLEGRPGVPAPGELVEDPGEVTALIRPYVEGETWWRLWNQADGKTTEARRVHWQLLAELWERVSALHAMGLVIRDLSPGNILVTGAGPVLLDFELAQELTDSRPVYRRGTRGFYDPRRAPFGPPSLREDYHAMLALALWAGLGVHPAWLPGGIHDMVRGGAPTLPGTHAEAWRRAYEARAHPKAFGEAMDALLRVAPAQETSVFFGTPGLPENAKGAFRAHMRERIHAWLDGPLDVDGANVYSGAAGLLLTAMEWDGELAADLPAARVGERLLRESDAVAHIPGLYFGYSGMALAMVALGHAAGEDAVTQDGLRLLTRGLPSTEVPDICQGLAGYILAALAAGRVTGEAEALARAREAGERLMNLGAGQGSGGVAWPWPEGPYGSLAGECGYGFAHGTAGVVYALLRLYEAAGGGGFAGAAEKGLCFLEGRAQRLEDDAVFWPCSDSDGTVWNAWCHGTPGVVKALALAVESGVGDCEPLLARAVRGVARANNAGYSLCHGVASRVDAYTAARRAMPLPAEADARGDAALLAGLDVYALEPAAEVREVGTESGGLMIGAAGVVRTLLAFHELLDGPHGRLLP